MSYDLRLKRLANNLLRDIGVEGFPTPTNKILEDLGLTVEEFGEKEDTYVIDKDDHRALGELFLDKNIQKIRNKNKGCFKQPPIKAFLDINNQIIGVNTNIHPSARSFSIEHEIGHFYIPEHRQAVLRFECSYFDLSHSTTRLMEREANEFASHLRFQGDYFQQVALDYPLSINSAIKLATMFEASLESTFIRYVTTNTNPCVLVVADLWKREATLSYSYEIKSDRLWVSKNKFINSSPRIPTYGIMKTVPINQVHEINEPPRITTNYLYPAEVFTNGYKVFVLCKTYTSKVAVG